MLAILKGIITFNLIWKDNFSLSWINNLHIIQNLSFFSNHSIKSRRIIVLWHKWTTYFKILSFQFFRIGKKKLKGGMCFYQWSVGSQNSSSCLPGGHPFGKQRIGTFCCNFCTTKTNTVEIANTVETAKAVEIVKCSYSNIYRTMNFCNMKMKLHHMFWDIIFLVINCIYQNSESKGLMNP